MVKVELQMHIETWTYLLNPFLFANVQNLTSIQEILRSNLAKNRQVKITEFVKRFAVLTFYVLQIYIKSVGFIEEVFLKTCFVPVVWLMLSLGQDHDFQAFFQGLATFKLENPPASSAMECSNPFIRAPPALRAESGIDSSQWPLICCS